MGRFGFVFVIASALLFAQNVERPGTTTAVIQNQPALSLTDIEKMLAAQVPEDVIALKVKQVRKAFTLSAEEIIALKKSGASDALLKLLMDPALSYGSGAAEMVVPDGTEVKLVLKSPLSSATAQPEQRIEFTASEPVLIHGATVIARGAAAVGHVTEVQAKKGFGRKGKLNFSIDTVQAVSGENIRLRSSKTASGSDSYGTAGVVTLLTGPFGALVKGKDIEVAAGTEFTIYIDGDRKLSLPSKQ
jgi:hypothetical protein